MAIALATPFAVSIKITGRSLFFISAMLASGVGRSQHVMVALKTLNLQMPDALRTLEFCLACPDPHLEGSQIRALGAVHGPRDYTVSGELTYAVPNQAVGKYLLNVDQLKGRIGLVDRGSIPMVDKVLALQKAGAIGVIIADDGNCDEQYECGLAGSLRDGGFSKTDPHERWKDVKIPSLLVTEEEGGRLKQMMRLEKVKVPMLGEQWIERRR